MWLAGKKNQDSVKTKREGMWQSPGGRCGADRLRLYKHELELDRDAQAHADLVATVCQAAGQIPYRASRQVRTFIFTSQTGERPLDTVSHQRSAGPRRN